MKLTNDNYDEQDDEIEKEDEIETSQTDKDVLKDPQKELLEGIETEEYDIKPVFHSASDLNLDLSEKEGISFRYTFNGAEVAEGLRIFQKETIYKRNMLYTALLLVLFIVYLYSSVKDPTQFMNTFLCVICVVFIGFIWYVPFSHLKKTAKAADTTALEFNMTVYDNCIEMGEENGSFVMLFNKEITKIFETSKLFLICAGKERMFVLPKRCLENGQVNQLKDIFKKEMKDKYIFIG